MTWFIGPGKAFFRKGQLISDLEEEKELTRWRGEERDGLHTNGRPQARTGGRRKVKALIQDQQSGHCTRRGQ